MEGGTGELAPSFNGLRGTDAVGRVCTEAVELLLLLLLLLRRRRRRGS